MKKHILLVGIFVSMLVTPQISKGQVLISLLFGEALNTDKIEFGLTGGYNASTLSGLDAGWRNNFNLGFYFHIEVNAPSYISTGVLVKSTVGAAKMTPYTIGDEDLDNLFADGELSKKINYFYVPALYHIRLNDNRWYLEGGLMAGLRYKAVDIFTDKQGGGDVEFKIDVRDEYRRFDIGFMGGVGYKFKREIKSMSAGLSYYYGFVDVFRSDEVTARNTSIYVFLRIPIGAGKKAQEKQKKGKKASKKG